jgi:hypothetical protein
MIRYEPPSGDSETYSKARTVMETRCAGERRETVWDKKTTQCAKTSPEDAQGRSMNQNPAELIAAMVNKAAQGQPRKERGEYEKSLV